MIGERDLGGIVGALITWLRRPCCGRPLKLATGLPGRPLIGLLPEPVAVGASSLRRNKTVIVARGTLSPPLRQKSITLAQLGELIEL